LVCGKTAKEVALGSITWRVLNPGGKWRVVVTKELAGESWLDILLEAGCSVEVCDSKEILTPREIRDAIGERCDACIGQLTEKWDEELFSCLEAAGGRVYSNYAVGHDNVDIDGATRHGIAVGNTPGVLTETTAEMAVALTFAAARRVAEGDRFMRSGGFSGWLPTLYLGKLLWRKTVGIIGAGRIGTAYGRMMVEGHRMNLIYHDLERNQSLEDHLAGFNRFLESQGEQPVTCSRAGNIEELLREADVVSLHCGLDQSTRHIIDATRLDQMKDDAVLVNTSRGPLIDEEALVERCRAHPLLRVGLDVYEDEPDMKPGLSELENVVIVPHLGSASTWTRGAMAVLAARNVVGVLFGYPAWPYLEKIAIFLEERCPKAVPSIVNAEQLGTPIFQG
jgi:hydroxypyruvate reductase 1